MRHFIKSGNRSLRPLAVALLLTPLAASASDNLRADTNAFGRFFFISDMQKPLSSETIFSKPFRNREARDSLFADIIRQNPGNLFMLGDLTELGSSKKAWNPLDGFLRSLQTMRTAVCAIPGNHEYMVIAPAGMKNFMKRFPEKWLYGYCNAVDSVGVVLLNSNFGKLRKNELSRQLLWYKTTMDSLDRDPAIKAIIVCTHHAPFSNSAVVGCNDGVIGSIVPEFEKSRKAILFISGHSHNLEHFASGTGKHYIVIGGGGGIAQPLLSATRCNYRDLIPREKKPLYFYVVAQREGNSLRITARGLSRDFTSMTLEIDRIAFNGEKTAR
jgi:hypothetical protein